MIGESFSHYRIEEKLGEGGMGEVWKALDTRLDRHVAIKFVPEKTANDAQTVDRFLREARAASALNHPHICTIYDIGETDGRRFIVMELLEGRTLRQMVAERPLQTEAILDLGVQIADALDAAHAKGIVHRDIKATNIIVSDRGQAKILDFGLAKLAVPDEGKLSPEAATAATVGRDITDPGATVGTIHYMSPEQALGKEVDGRTDLFSLGVVLYELATGRPAFRGDTSAAVFDAILNRAPVAPVELNPDIPRELERIINKALEKNRDLRYQSAAELGADLKRLKRDSSSQSAVQSASLAAVVPAPARRKPWPMYVGGGAIVLLAAVAVYSFLSREAPPPETHVSIRPLTGQVGFEVAPTWSPDGSFFAYARAAEGPLDIFVMATGGGDPIPLVQSPADDGMPAWSPDGRWIAFMSNRDGEASVYLVPPLGGPVQKLVDTGVPPLSSMTYGILGAMPWSPDGRRLVLARLQAQGNLALWTIDLDSGTESQITHPESGEGHGSASWSHDGKKIVYSRYAEGGSSLWIQPVEGGDPQKVFGDENGNFGASWSPDDRELVFTSNRGGSDNLWVVDIARGTPRPLTTGQMSDGAPVVGKNGEIIYSSTSHQTDLYLQDLGTGEQKRLTQHTQDNFDAQISPDGTQVAYMSTRTGNSEIWILGLASGSERQLTNHESSDWGPVWSPDGKEILFGSDRGGVAEGWIVDAKGGVPRKLLSGGPKVQHTLRWSPDGGTIGFGTRGEGGNELWLVNRDGTEPHKVLDGVDDYGFYRDAVHVVYTPEEEGKSSEMRVRNLETGEEVVLFSEPHRELDVARDGSAVSYCSSTSHFNMNLHVLRLVPPASPGGLPQPASRPEVVTEGRGLWHVHNGGWSPDAKQVIYTRDTDAGDIFVMTGAF